MLADGHLTGRVDLKARCTEGTLEVLSAHFESPKPAAREHEALRQALEHFSASVGLRLRAPSRSGEVAP